MLSLAFRFLRAKTPEQRAMVDLETHYTKFFSFLSSYRYADRRYPAVPPKIDRRRLISTVSGRLNKKSTVSGRLNKKSTVSGRLNKKSTVGGRLREKSTVDGRLRKKKGRRRGKEEKKKRRIPHLRVVLARGRFFSRTRRRSVSLRGENDRGD
ncbi:hypothetical protein BHE74_00019334, partial [Ensete ventricosum]